MSASLVNVVVFGATGDTGRWITDRAVQAGHGVTALVRDPGRLRVVHDRVKIVRGDVLDPASVDGAVPAKDAVPSALGSTARSAAPGLPTGVRPFHHALER